MVPGVAGAHRVHPVHAEHGGRVHHVLARAIGALAFFERGAGVSGQVAVARAVYEAARQHGGPAGSGFDQQRADRAAAVHPHAHRLRMEQQLGAAGQHELVGSDLEGRVVVGLRGDPPAEQPMRLVEPVQRAHAIEQLVGQAVHHLADLAVHVGVQAAEVGHTRGRAHAAQKTVTLHQQRALPGARGSGRGGDAGRPAAEHHDVEMAENRRLPCGLGDAGGGGVGWGGHGRCGADGVVVALSRGRAGARRASGLSLPVVPTFSDGPSMKLYNYFRSSASFRVRIALNLKGLAYDYVPVHLAKGEHKLDAYAAVSADRLVPMLELDDGTRLSQSMAIIEFLDETRPGPALLPADALGKARVRALAQSIACEIHPLNNLRVLKYLGKDLGLSEDARNTWYRHWVRDGLESFERQLAAQAPSTYCHGETPTLADCCLVPQIFNGKRFNVNFDGLPRTMAAFDACMALDAFQKAQPSACPDFEA